MKLLIDFSQLAYRTFFVDMRDRQDDFISNAGFWKHMVLNSILKFKKKYGIKSTDIYLCADHKITWRKEVFPNYKARRALNRKKSGQNFDDFFKVLENFYGELKTIFPFHFIQTKFAEGDDCIGILSNHFSSLNEDFVIISNDSDFSQLHSLKGFRGQFNPNGESITTDSPTRDLYLKILNGDSTDDIPNVLSDDDTFINPNKRQKKFGEKAALKVLESNETLKKFLDENDVKKNFKRNQRLVDLSKIPDQIKDKIIREYIDSKPNNNKLIMDAYFQQNDMERMHSRLSEF